MICPSHDGSITAASLVSESATRYAFVCAGPNVKETISSMTHLSRREMIGHKNGNEDQSDRQRVHDGGIIFEENPCDRRRKDENHRADGFHNSIRQPHLGIVDKLARLCLRQWTPGAK